jgi:hypothetical protein
VILESLDTSDSPGPSRYRQLEFRQAILPVHISLRIAVE